MIRFSIVAIAMLVVLPATGVAQPAPPRVRIAEILEARGTVEISKGADQPWRLVGARQELVGSDLLRTVEGAWARLKFDAGPQWVLREQSRLRLAALTGASTSNTIQVRLESGKAVIHWTPDRRPEAKTAARAIVETPSGLASIQGTEWSISVDADGRTAIVVLGGSVELSNALASVTVHSSEAAEMRVGRAPVLLRVINPRDRVQWVADYAAQPQRFADPSMGVARAAFDLSVADATAGRTTAAIDRLEGLTAASTPAGVILALTDLLIEAGELERARTHAEAGRKQFSTDARFDAMLSRIALFDGRIGDSRTLAAAATVKDPMGVDGWLTLGESALNDGDGTSARHAFQRTTVVNAADARGWFGRGRVETDYEAFVPARRWLSKALEIDPKGPGYRGEIGTVETLANRLDAAEREFSQALLDRPGDYVAMTGRALLSLKEGREAEALDLLLSATLIEPRYARAQMYLGVTYYRLRRHDDAIRALRRANELDPKDPLPYMMATAIHTDLYEPAKALVAARKARDLMPYLKSLNQLSNTQQGTTNLGNSVAFFGMESWAQHLAQESYYPFWAGSHLFLGDRYGSPYARASEYYQGLLADPTVFGGSPMFQTLLPRAGDYQSAESSIGRDGARLLRNDGRVSANGYSNIKFPLAYAISGTTGRWRSGPSDPPERHGPGNVAGAVGITPSARWGFFVAGSASRDRLEWSDDAQPIVWSGTGGRVDVGANLRRSPLSSLAFKGGYGTGEADIPVPGAFIHVGGREHDIQARYAVLVRGRHEVSAGLNVATKDELVDLGPRGAALRFDRALASQLAFASARLVSRRVLVQSDLFVHRGRSTMLIGGTGESIYRSTVLEPRIGGVLKLGSGVLRGAFQKRIQPLAAASSLGPVATAGVPLDEEFLQPGGAQRRGRLQLDWEWSEKLFTSAFADAQHVRNLLSLNGFGRGWSDLVSDADGAPQPYFAKALTQLRDAGRDVSRLNVNALTQLEGDPNVANGMISAGGLVLNRLLTNRFSIQTQYRYTHSSDGGRPVLFVPAHALSLGGTYVSPSRVYLSVMTLGRSSRTVAINTLGTPELRAGDWTARVAGSWETRDKRWAIELTAFDLLAKSVTTSYGITARFRR